MSKPSHIAYVLTEPKDDDQKAIWHRIGSIWPHKKGNGFDLVIPKGISVSGRVVCTEFKERSEEPADDQADNQE